MPSPQFLSEKNDVDMELSFGYMTSYPTLQQASEALKDHHGITVSPAKLEVFGRRFPERVEQARNKVAQIREANLKANLGDIAELSTVATKVAIVRSHELLEDVHDPEKASKIARDLSQVTTQSLDKKALMEGKPTQIVEKRSTDEILRALEAKGIVERPELDVPEAEIVDDG